MGLGKYDEAMKAFDKAIEINPRVPDALKRKETSRKLILQELTL